ncbi:MAG: NUDIX domain-containing protein [Oscillospiraceae bacterium]|nr:NUDIX domain-containing protein [Oscillospiraceae bacterium]
MRVLFEIDKKDYITGGTVTRRPSVRGIIVRDGRLAMVHSLKYDYYKFPGGGIEPDETHEQALIREVREETGLRVLPESIRAFGMVRRLQRGWNEDLFLQENYYYFCEVSDLTAAQMLDDYEAEERFTLEFVTAAHARDVNLTHPHPDQKPDSQLPVVIERENRVLGMLQKQRSLL